ncbi:exodeoxyribonuclease VII large subunit [Pseudoteredinibacter isoporae]|uniref:Exodeoxyribonuclease 7 large subunit n=1 Tax=Pseudoteredinibacter isoporae TaxID=570281 RepID=A0A7X0JVR8_9GAMM|nr:exodeoxyribonuclease VII large subunit [Pseudoteredinibacter isoporae]MBB6523138.1 exodeoxyribonuclease VII large subunit [Pseudoteredinibacter isoporae]NHO88657.1 exodeoxyribonuclease VII large subunit [Pseudoteredinibacter isoporae]NIB22652.1 exodeoxyribonuclease VII large subunit [Pseudoteredinibacter isoporae]
MNQAQDRQVLSVSQLNRKAKQLLETHLPLIWLEGEISNFARPSSGHWYLTLKDQSAQVRGAMFRNRNQMLRFNPNNGDKVLVRARVSLYEGRGDYQLIIEHMQPAGAGDLQAQFDALKNKLFQQGLMADERKRPLPEKIERIGIITSPTGAAVKDVLTVLERRSPSTRALILPCQVQGDAAAPQLIEAINIANRHQCCDVLLLTRGGGSLEDLWAFNNEALAYAIVNSEIPIVSAVGHEVDFTIADFVADLRAATPSAAAEILSQDREALQQQLLGNAILLGQACQRKVQTEKLRLQQLQRRLRHPGQTLEQQAQQLDNLELRLQQAWQRQCTGLKHRQEQLLLRLSQQHPQERFAPLRDRLLAHKKQLDLLIKNRMERRELALHTQMEKLNALSPLAVLQRGFSITRNENGNILKRATDSKTGDAISVQLNDGTLDCRVEACHTSE